MLKVITEGCEPTKGSKYSACIDLRSAEDITIGAGETVLIPLGVKISKEDMPVYLQNNLHRHYLQLMLRSSLSKELIIANGVGVIDMDYTGEIMIRVHKPISEFEENQDDTLCQIIYEELKIKKGQRVAQIAILEHKSYLLGIESDEERSGGFGSTGEN